tara:strand:+ start:51 stop:200 length:150 start_codon:yes stop_codon:yes gene_type:complete
LKENVIVGRLIPAGTGKMSSNYNEVAKKRDLERLASNSKENENIENISQ